MAASWNHSLTDSRSDGIWIIAQKHDLMSELSNSLPKISIGIVVYNGIEHIRSALDSIVKQTYKDIELVVVDGGSEDGTQIVLNEYAQHISVLVCEPDKGIYDAMNKVCALATGDWLIFLGCDDVLLDAFKRVAVLLSHPDTVYYGDVIKRSSGKIYGGKFSKYRLMRYNICHQALFYPKSVYKKYSYSLDYRCMADYANNIKLMGDGVPFVYTGVVVSIFNDEGRSASGDADFARDQLKLIRASFGNTYALLETLRRLRLRQKLLKCLSPRSWRKYLQPWWRSMRSKY
jgi:glycosyltransferase involved in cell wall biosynthesis